MRKIAVLSVFLLSCSAISDPSYAGKGKPEINVRNFTYKTICNQSDIFRQHPDALKAEGLGDLIPQDNKMSEMEDEESDEIEDAGSSGLSQMSFNFITQMQSHLAESTSLLNKEEGRPQLTKAQASQALDEALKEEFLRKKSLEMKKILGQNMVPALWDGTCVSIAACVGIGGQFGVATAFGRLIVTAKEALRDVIIGGRDILSSENDPLEDLELQYVVKKRFLDRTQQVNIENMLTAARASTSGLNKALDELPLYLNIPIQNVKPRDNFEEIAKAIDHLASGYETEEGVDLAEKLKNFCMNHLSRFKDTKGVNEVPKHILALEGEPGMGKSHIAKALAKIMGLNGIEVSFAGGMNDFFGTKSNPGAFLRGIGGKDNPHLNDLIIYEEVDRLLNEKKDAVGPALRIFDPKAEELDLLGFGKYDSSHHAIIALMNHPVECKGMNDRWEVIKILGVKQKNKENILLNESLPIFLRSDLPGLDLTVDNLPKEELNKILSQTTPKGFRNQEAQLRDLCAKTRRAKMQDGSLAQPTPRKNPTHSVLEQSDEI